MFEMFVFECILLTSFYLTVQNNPELSLNIEPSESQCAVILHYFQVSCSPMRAMGTPACSVCTVLSTAAWTEGNEQTADTMASGMP